MLVLKLQLLLDMYLSQKATIICEKQTVPAMAFCLGLLDNSTTMQRQNAVDV